MSVLDSNDSLSFAVEHPFLVILTISDFSDCLVGKITHVSTIFLGDDIELSVAIETIFWVVFSCLIGLLIFDVSDIPS